MKHHDNLQSSQTILNIVSGIFTMIIQLGINFFLSPYIVKTLGEEANGFTQLANNFVTYASLVTVAFNSMAGRFVSISFHRNEDEKVKQYYSTTFICNIFISAVFSLLSIIIVFNLDKIVRIQNAVLIDVKFLFGCVFINFIANLFLSIYGIALFVKNKIYIQNVINLIRTLLNAVVLLGVFTLLPPRIFYVSFVSLILTLVAIPLIRYFQKRYMPELKVYAHEFSINALMEMIKSGIWNTVNQCGNMLMTGLDLLLANWFIGPVQMGILSVAKTIPNAITQLAGIMNTSFAPAITMEWAKGDKTTVLRQLRSSMKVSSMIVSIPVVTFSFFSSWFYKLWMPTLNSTMLAILSFLTCMAFIPWAGPQTLYNVFTAANKLKVNSIAFVISGVLNIVIVYILLIFTDFGVYAIAGVSSILTIIRNLFIVTPYTAKILGLKWYTFYKDILISIICCLINFLVASAVSRIIYEGGWISLIVAVFLTVLFSFLIEIVVILNRDEKQMVFKIFHK